MGRNDRNNQFSTKTIRLEEKPLTDEVLGNKPPKIVNGQQQIHIDLFLKASGTKIWERGGKKAFAIAKGFEYGTEQTFQDLFRSY